ncbi:MAG: hypothetical protein U0228_35630 [Myxococcaceae bacterium]
MHAAATLAAALSVGSLSWVFLVQAPLLSRALGRDRFVPLMMTLVRPLVLLAGAASVVMAVGAPGEHHRVLAGAGVVLCVALWLVAPRALAAGRASLRESLGADDQHSAARFVADGGGDATKGWHRVLGLLAVALLASQVAWLVVPASHEHRFHATPETAEGVAALRTQVADALAHPPTQGAPTAAALRQTWSSLFTRCTMTGEAHAALHAFLAPLGEGFEELEAANDEASTAAALRGLQRQLDTWGERFE